MARPLPVGLNSFEGTPGDQPSNEKKVARVEISSEDGLVIWREIYDDGTPGVWERTGTDVTQSPIVFDELAKRYGGEKLPGGDRHPKF